MPLKESGGWRQHCADHECCHDREKECFRDIKNGNNADNQERHESKGTNLGTADNRRQLVLAVRRRGTNGPIGKDTQLALPALQTGL
jgi:hypothetical protein